MRYRGAAIAIAVGIVAVALAAVLQCDGRRERLQQLLASRAREDFGRYALQGENPVFRGNALVAAQMLKDGSFQPESRPLLVSAVFSQDPQGPAGIVIIHVLAHERDAENVVMLFQDCSEGKTVQMLAAMPPSEEPDFSGVYLMRAFSVQLADILPHAKPGSDGVYHIQEGDVRNSLVGGLQRVPLPDGEVAVGLLYGGGVYTNFVPLFRHRRQEPGAPASPSPSSAGQGAR